MDFDTFPTADLPQQDVDTFGSTHPAESGILAVEDPMMTTLPALLNDDDDDDDDDAGGLFGDGEDDDAPGNMMDQDEQPPPLPALDSFMDEDDGLTEEERRRRQALEYDESDEPAMAVPDKEQRVAQIQLANYPVPAGGKVWHARLPNFLSLESSPFDADKWQPPKEAAPSADDNESGSRRAPVPDENVMRWRWSRDELGQFVKESNSRIVRWSDGSLSLQVGQELFDITMAVDHSAILTSTQAANPIPPSAAVSSSLAPTSFDQDRGHSLTFLTARHDYTELVEAQASVFGTLTFRPTTLQSNTHRRLAGSIAARNVKGRSIKLANLPQIDPEKQKAERERAEVEKAKKARKSAKRSSGGSKKKGERRATKLVFGSDEEEQLSDQEEDDADEDRPRGATAGRDAYDEEDDFLAADEDAASGSDNGREPDEVEEAEARIEQDERRRRKGEAGDSQAEPTPAPRRRLVVEDSDEE